jgi:hypothetical protein
MYDRLTLMRKFEERLKWLVEAGVPVGPVHFYAGQACPLGVWATGDRTREATQAYLEAMDVGKPSARQPFLGPR